MAITKKEFGATDAKPVVLYGLTTADSQNAIPVLVDSNGALKVSITPSLSSVYAKLDGSNQPFTGNMGISKDTPFFYLVDTFAGVTSGFSASYAQFADPLGSGAYGFLYFDRVELYDDGGFQKSSIISNGTQLQIYPDTLNSPTVLSLQHNSMDLAGSDPGFFISAGGGSSVVRYDRFQFANDGSAYSEISGDGYTSFRITPSSVYDIGVNFNLGGMELVGTDLNTFNIYTKSFTTGTNQGGTILNLSGAVVTGNAVSYVTIKATGGGSSGSTTKSPTSVSTFEYNLVTDAVNYKCLKKTPSIKSVDAVNGKYVNLLGEDPSIEFSDGGGSPSKLTYSSSTGYKFGIGTNAYATLTTTKLQFESGSSPGAGSDSTIQAQNANTSFGATNINAGDLLLKPGAVVGTGVGNLEFYAAGGNASGSTVYNPVLVATMSYNTLTFADAKNIAFNTTTGTKIGTATTQKIGFFNATPIVQVGATIDLGVVLSNLGLRAAGTAYTITTSGAVSFTGTIGLGGSITITDAKDIAIGTTTGTKIGTATTQKISLWNATPIVQPTTAVAAATFVANTSGIADDTATFDGYTIGQVVKALRNIGALA